MLMKKYSVKKDKATGRKTYFPLPFGSLVEVPCKTATEALEWVSRIESELSKQETKTGIKSGEELGQPAIIQTEPKEVENVEE